MLAPVLGGVLVAPDELAPVVGVPGLDAGAGEPVVRLVVDGRGGVVDTAVELGAGDVLVRLGVGVAEVVGATTGVSVYCPCVVAVSGLTQK